MEYKVMSWDAYMTVSLESTLNEMGAAGWKLVFLNMRQSGDFVTMVFERKI